MVAAGSFSVLKPCFCLEIRAEVLIEPDSFLWTPKVRTLNPFLFRFFKPNLGVYFFWASLIQSLLCRKRVKETFLANFHGLFLMFWKLLVSFYWICADLRRLLSELRVSVSFYSILSFKKPVFSCIFMVINLCNNITSYIVGIYVVCFSCSILFFFKHADCGLCDRVLEIGERERLEIENWSQIPVLMGVASSEILMGNCLHKEWSHTPSAPWRKLCCRFHVSSCLRLCPCVHVLNSPPDGIGSWLLNDCIGVGYFR